MTVLLAIAVKPKDGLKPYFLMGTDSLGIASTPIFSQEGEFLYYENPTKNHNYKKIFKIKDILIGMTGRFNIELTEQFLRFLEENYTDIDTLSKRGFDYIKTYIHNDEIMSNSRCTVTMGSCDHSKPVLVHFAADAINPKAEGYFIQEPSAENPVHVVAGNTDDSIDLEETFISRVQNNSINFNLRAVRNAAEEYLLKVAARHPETCNQNIKFEVLR